MGKKVTSLSEVEIDAEKEAQLKEQAKLDAEEAKRLEAEAAEAILVKNSSYQLCALKNTSLSALIELFSKYGSI